MKTSRPIYLPAALSGLLLSACGIDQGGLHDQPDPTPPVIVSGPITGFGSVQVNGISLETTDARILIDSSPAVASDLRAGQVIRAIALSDGNVLRALSIDYQENVIGPIQAVDLAGSSLTVLRQRILSDASTRFDLPQVTGLGDLQPGESVSISGLRTPAGDLLATYIGPARTATLEIAAPITALDQASLRFQLGELTVDYSAATLLNLPGGMPELGVAVEVTGTTLANDMLAAQQVRGLELAPGLISAAATALTASEATLVEAPATAGGLNASIAGFVAATSLPGSFSLSGVEVSIDARTTIIGGVVNDLQVGTLVRVEGLIPAPGLIRADRITIL